ncbi:MAG: SBBP repeat-containing protein [Bacteroidota bacterium]
MKTKLLAITLLTSLVLWNSTAISQNLAWAKQLGGADYEYARAITVDANGNVYTTGEFRSTADFDPGSSSYNLTSASSCCGDVFISKLDASGNFVWAKQFSGNSFDVAFAIAVDANGNVYTTGMFTDTTDFDPGPGVYNLISAGSDDIFVSKLDDSGNFVWAKRLGSATSAASGSSLDVGYGIAVDASGNVYTAGNFYDTADFDPDNTITYDLTSFGTHDIYVSKLDASGNFVWAKQMGGTADDFARSVALDVSGNIYVTGNFYNIADFDPGSDTFNLTAANSASYQNYDIFIAKLDAAGNFVWAKQLGGPHTTGSFLSDNGYSIVVDAQGNIYTTGYFPDTADFDPGAGTYNLMATGGIGSDIFVSKLNSSGNFVWAKQLGGTYSDVAYSVAVDGNGSVYTTGFFYGMADFDPANSTYNLVTTGGASDGDIFISKLDSSGNYVWAGSMGGISSDVGTGIAVDAGGTIYATGNFGSPTADFDPGVALYNLTASGSSDMYVMKLTNITGMEEVNNGIDEITVYPNPGNGQFQVRSNTDINEIKITNVLGQIVYQTKPTQLLSGENNLSFNIDKTGIYFAQFTLNKQIITKKIIVRR